MGWGTAQADGGQDSTGRELLFYNHSYGVFDRETADAIEHSDYLREFANFQVRTTSGHRRRDLDRPLPDGPSDLPGTPRDR